VSLVLVAAAVAFMILPVQATYLNDVGSDFQEFRTASCGAPVASLLGADPELGGGSELPIGGTTSTAACQAASGKRVIGALVLLLAASVAWGLARSIRSPSEHRPADPSSV
jgi:hypothetical protein